MNVHVKPSPDRLKEFAAEHLYYEIRMLYGVSELLQGEVKDIYVYNALLESFVIHASTILDFFYKPAADQDDAKAGHYMKDMKKWKEALPVQNKYFKKFFKKRNKWVMHLSYRRLDVDPEDKRWDSPMLVEEIKKTVDAFLREADPGLLNTKLCGLSSDKFKR